MRAIILVILTVVSVPLVLRRPLLGVGFYLGANVIRPETLFWGGDAGSFIFKFYFALVFVACWYQGYFGRVRQVLQREYLLMLLFFFALALSAITAQFESEKQMYYLAELFKCFAFLALVYLTVQEFSDIDRIQKLLIACFAFLGIWGLQQSMLGNERLEGLGGSAWGDSNYVAAVFVLFLPVVFALLANTSAPREQWLLVGVAALMVAVIVCTKSRAGFTGLVTCLFSYGYYTGRTKKVLLWSCLCAALVAPLVAETYLERMKTMTNVGDTDDFEGSARSRLILWKAGLMVFADHPMLGTGFMTYPEAKMEYEHRFDYLEDRFRRYVFRTEAKKVTHNTYIQLLSDCGLVGAAPFFVLMLHSIARGFRARRLVRQGMRRPELIWLSCITAGITGFAVCLITMDFAMIVLLYVQISFAAMLERMLRRDALQGCSA